MNDTEIRNACLSLAIEAMRTVPPDGDKIVALAEKFYTFVYPAQKGDQTNR